MGLTQITTHDRIKIYALVAELVDAVDSKSAVCKNMRVRVSPKVP